MSDFPPPSIGPPPILPAKPPNDNFIVGCAMGCGSTIGFALLSLLLALAFDSSGHGKLSNDLLASWGLTQWLGIVPIIMVQRSRGYKNRVTGLIVAGCVGLLLSSACAELVFNLGNMR